MDDLVVTPAALITSAEVERLSRDLETVRATIARVREVHRVHSCERDSHVHASTPTPCVNDGYCSCGCFAPCATLTALTTLEEP
ncbi:hypothetical protein ACQPYK_49735 (plasmid) [Streptosporangium sp. CA-135522]|uniref:hypothetical protein n=1 Tax=Streptosporangium sp. CA-135522 TaxID=3240072 RepID=UPI003D8D194A